MVFVVVEDKTEKDVDNLFVERTSLRLSYAFEFILEVLGDSQIDRGFVTHKTSLSNDTIMVPKRSRYY